MNATITSREFSAWSTPLGTVGQIGIVVPDLDAAMDLYGQTFGVPEWSVYHYDQQFMPWSRFAEAEGAFAMDIAMAGVGPQIELIQPLAGPSVYHEFLAEGRSGLHHLGVYVDDLDQATALMVGRGYRVTQTARGYGLNGDGGFAYFDTERDLGVVVEAIEVPVARRPPILRQSGKIA